MKKHLNKRQLQHQQTLEHIREAVDILAKRGFLTSMTVRDICREAGITVGTFYYYFPSKADLLIDRYKRTNDYFDQLGEQVLSKLEAEEAIRVLTQEFINYVYSRVFSILIEYTKATLENKNHKISQGYLKKWAGTIIERGQSSGAFRTDVSAEVLVELYLIYLNGLSISHCISKGSRTSADPVNQLLLESITAFLKPVKIS